MQSCGVQCCTRFLRPTSDLSRLWAQLVPMTPLRGLRSELGRSSLSLAIPVMDPLGMPAEKAAMAHQTVASNSTKVFYDFKSESTEQHKKPRDKMKYFIESGRRNIDMSVLKQCFGHESPGKMANLLAPQMFLLDLVLQRNTRELLTYNSSISLLGCPPVGRLKSLTEARTEMSTSS